MIGVDLGLKNLGVTSDGTVFENQKHLKQSLARLKHLHRSLSRKHAGSQRCEKTKRRLQREYYRIECGRQDAIHKMTTSLCQDYAVIGLEDLHVAGMVRNHRLSQALSDAAFGEIKRQLGIQSRLAWGAASVRGPILSVQ